MTHLEGPSDITTSLYDCIASKLPAGHAFSFHHISTPPSKHDPLFAPAPGRKPEKTYCESHFLTVSSQSNGQLGLLFALEVLIFTTKRLTTIFVSKADSTGLLASLGLRRGSGATLVRTVSSEFINWLVEHRQRPGIRLVVSLFARAQGQYLFPSSVDNKGKHVLDDRQLVKWWCKTLDPVARRPSTTATSQAYLIVPGSDSTETRDFFPPTWRQDPVENRKWRHGHPLDIICSNPNLPPRCLIPHFPDDPKARYLDDLDFEIPDTQGVNTLASPSKKGNGMWKSVKTLSQFWEMMAFRQECSAGRMVGFIWVVFTPDDLGTIHVDDNESVYSSVSSTPMGSFSAGMPSISEVISQESNSSSPRRSRTKEPLTGRIVPRTPRIKKASSELSMLSLKEESPFWKWPLTSRGQVVLDTTDYTRIHDLLLKLDFGNDDAVRQSTAKWLEEASMMVGAAAERWGQTVQGTFVQPVLDSATSAPTGSSGQPNNLSGMLVRKKRKAVDQPAAENTTNEPAAPAVNMLSGSVIRKKPKT